MSNTNNLNERNCVNCNTLFPIVQMIALNGSKSPDEETWICQSCHNQHYGVNLYEILIRENLALQKERNELILTEQRLRKTLTLWIGLAESLSE